MDKYNPSTASSLLEDCRKVFEQFPAFRGIHLYLDSLQALFISFRMHYLAAKAINRKIFEVILTFADGPESILVLWKETLSRDPQYHGKMFSSSLIRDMEELLHEQLMYFRFYVVDAIAMKSVIFSDKFYRQIDGFQSRLEGLLRKFYVFAAGKAKSRSSSQEFHENSNNSICNEITRELENEEIYEEQDLQQAHFQRNSTEDIRIGFQPILSFPRMGKLYEVLKDSQTLPVLESSEQSLFMEELKKREESGSSDDNLTTSASNPRLSRFLRIQSAWRAFMESKIGSSIKITSAMIINFMGELLEVRDFLSKIDQNIELFSGDSSTPCYLKPVGCSTLTSSAPISPVGVSSCEVATSSVATSSSMTLSLNSSLLFMAYFLPNHAMIKFWLKYFGRKFDVSIEDFCLALQQELVAEKAFNDLKARVRRVFQFYYLVLFLLQFFRYFIHSFVFFPPI